jgi:hypothetical protein
VEVVSPGNELTVEDRSKHKEAIMAINETRSVWSLDLLLAREAHSEFDPFAGWVLVDAGVELSYYHFFLNIKVWVKIKCPQPLTTEYQMRVMTHTARGHRTLEALPSGGYSYRLELAAPEGVFKENSLVSIIYNSGVSPKRSFRVGTLHYEFEKHRWQFTKEPSPPAPPNVGHVSEGPEEVLTDIELAPTRTPADESTVDSGQAVVESRNGLSRSSDQQPEPETNLKSDPFAGWSSIATPCRVNTRFWVTIKCPKQLTGSWYFDFEDYITAAKYTQTIVYPSDMCSCHLECPAPPNAYDQSRNIPVDLLSYAPRLGDAYLKPNVSRFPLGHFKYDRGWKFVQRLADC